MNLKMEKEVEISSTLYNLMDDDSRIVFELSLLASNIKKEVAVCWILPFNFKENMRKKSPQHVFLNVRSKAQVNWPRN